jgi:hypothetical protein
VNSHRTWLTPERIEAFTIAFLAAIAGGLVLAVVFAAYPAAFAAISNMMGPLAQTPLAIFALVCLVSAVLAVLILALWRRVFKRNKDQKPKADSPSFGTATSQRDPPAFLIGKIMRFAVVDSRDLTSLDFVDLNKEMREAARQSSARMWYVAWVEIDSINTSTRATDWHFDIQRKDGSTVSAIATKKRWRRPKTWPDIEYTTLDAVEHSALSAGRVYNILIYLVIHELASNLALETFRARFTDGKGRTTTLMMDEARNAKRIFEEAEQPVSFRERVPLFAKAIRKALLAYHGRIDAADSVDTAIHAECTSRIGPLIDGLEATLGRIEIVASLRNGDYFTVRGMAQIADSLDIAAGKLPRE